MSEVGKIYRVLPSLVDQTLAVGLRHWLHGHQTWGDVRRLVRRRQVLVNGNLCLDVGRRLKLTDVIKVLEHPAAPPAREEDVRIRFLDKHLVVVEKPSGMTSVRHAEEREWSNRRKQEQPTLEDLLPRILAKKETGSAKPGRTTKRSPRAFGGSPRGRPIRTPPVRPVHRLDRDTSGLMVFARTIPAERHLGQQFRQHTTQRRYLAIVVGHPKTQRIESNLVRDRGDGRRGSTALANTGKRAVTHVRPLETLGGYTLVECRLETGRTHQIRIHLSELGHPVCGDKVYGRPPGTDTVRDQSGAPRLALHATELSLEHPETGARLEFEMPLPRDLQQFVERLRRGGRSPDGQTNS